MQKNFNFLSFGAAAFVLALAFGSTFLSSLAIITLVAFACTIQIIFDIFNTCS